ncbi:cGMP-specific 3',5'-cyclic phosphodiesterase-like isoform X2 [Babylonia areolata]|uniref:cGMP-specific 3',5'-cyclic phosphodiesterase-like isoform X2 n=1 Tax=Babylonia areolata TaxID=304850 RepID=UPI003FD549BB
MSRQNSAPLTEDQVDSYLKKNQTFLLRWLSENATKEIVETFAKKLKDKNWDDATPPVAHRGNKRAGGGGGGSTLGASLAFPQTARNSITSQIFRRYLDGDRSRKVAIKKDRKSMQRLSEEELFMELIRDIASELDVNLLCHKILQNVSILTNSDRGSLFLVRGSRDNKHLVSKLFDVTDTSTLEDSIHTESNEIKVPFGKGIVGIVAQSGKPINIKDAYRDPRFNQEIDRQTGYLTHSILSMPIVNYEGEVIGVAQIINKISGNHEFTPQDEDLFRKYLIFCGIGITNAQLFEMSVNEFKRNQLLLHLARGIFEEQTNLEKLVQKIMLDAQDLLKCEKCCVYLLEDTCERDAWTIILLASHKEQSQDPTAGQAAIADPKRPSKTADSKKPQTPEEVVFSKAFHLCAKDGTVTVPSVQELAASKTAHIAKFAVTSGEPVNVPDVDVDGRFGEGPYEYAEGKPIKSVLCMPIHNSEKNIIGVTQLINKLNGEPFNDNDANIIEAFSIFTGLGIHNCQMYENACQLMAKQSVALEVLSFHATAQTDEASSLATCEIPSADHLGLYTFDFDDRFMDDDGTLRASVRMFMDADIFNQFKVPYEVMCRWLCTVKKNYRPVTYHNWRHAFNVCQTMFTMLFTGELRPMFEDLEVFTLLAACLCHDLDHRGTNNAFQVKVASPLAMLYSTSVLEHHHFDHCIMILNSEGNNIFQSLSPEEYRRAIKLLEHAILSTDLALYFKKRGDFKTLVEAGEKTFEDVQKRDLLRAMMMTACDVAAITKPWEIQQEVAQLVTAEFFEQGDIERTQLGEQPIPMMDRNKKDELPKMQVGFIDAICAPVYKLFADITDKLDPLWAGCEFNRRKWQELSARREEAPPPPPLPPPQQDPPVTEEQPKPKDEAKCADDSESGPQDSQPDSGPDSQQHNSQRAAQDHPASHPDPAPHGPHSPAPQHSQSPVEITAVSLSTSSPSSSLPPPPSPSSQAGPPPPPPDSKTDNGCSSDPALNHAPAVGQDRYPRGGDPSPNQVPADRNSLPPNPQPAPHAHTLCPPQQDARARQQQNGTIVVSRQTDLTSDSEPYSSEQCPDSKQPRGKRKTHAQAHAHVAGERDKKKSGVCIVS